MREGFAGIEVFAAVAEAGSFTAAATRLSLTSSAVGKAIARLEERLEVRLFHRTTRSLVLTDEGAAFHETCKRLLAELEEARAVLTRRRTTPSGKLRIDLPVYFGRLQVMPLLRELLARHPALEVHASFTDRIIDLAEEGVDIAVRIGASGTISPLLASTALGTERLIFCAAPAYLRKRGTPRGPQDLARHDCVAYASADGRVAPWLLQRAGKPPEKLAPQARMVAGSIEAVVDAVVAGTGVAQLATWLIQSELKRGAVVQVLPQWVADGLSLHLVWQRNRQLLPKVNAAIEVLSTSLRIR